VLLFFMELQSLLFFLGGNCQAWVPFCMLMVCVCVCVWEKGLFFFGKKNANLCAFVLYGTPVSIILWMKNAKVCCCFLGKNVSIILKVWFLLLCFCCGGVLILSMLFFLEKQMQISVLLPFMR
jgi:hypothetical protein